MGGSGVEGRGVRWKREGRMGGGNKGRGTLGGEFREAMGRRELV